MKFEKPMNSSMMLKRNMQQVTKNENKTMRSKGEMWHATLETKKMH
jgi:hypothetical protein